MDTRTKLNQEPNTPQESKDQHSVAMSIKCWRRIYTNPCLVSSITQLCLLRPHGLQHTRLPCPSPTPRPYSNSCHAVGDVIQPSPPLSSPSPAFNFSQHKGFFQWVRSLHQVAKVLEFQLQHQSFQWIFRTDFLYNWLVWFPCSPRESQELSPTPQFKTIKSLFSLLYDTTLISIHDYWKNHSFD